MDVDDRFEIFLRDLFERSVANVAGVVNQDVDAAEVIERTLNDRLAALRCRDGFGASDGFTASLLDFANHFFGGTRIGAVTFDADTGIVHDDLRAGSTEEQGIFTPQSSAGAGDYGLTAVESALCHGALFGSWISAFAVAMVVPS